MIVCLDTHILIWGVQKVAKQSQVDMISRTNNFIQWLENEGHTIMVPSPVMGEFLMRIPLEDHPSVMKTFLSRFIIPPYDVPCASYFARIWQAKNSLRANTEDGPTREEVKIDSMIVAVAITHQAKIIYSEDKHICSIAEGFIETRPVPILPKQLGLGLN